MFGATKKEKLYWKIEGKEYHVPRSFFMSALYENIFIALHFILFCAVFFFFLCGVMALSVQTPVNLSVSESVSHNEGCEMNQDDDADAAAAFPVPPLTPDGLAGWLASILLRPVLSCQADDSVS